MALTIFFADENPCSNMDKLQACFDWMQKEINSAQDKLRVGELSLHETLEILSRLRLKTNSAIQYAQMEINKRELSRLGYTDKQVLEMSCI